ncbi:hypothetical protein [Enterobacter cloacae complex sp. 379K3]|uniref:hypothetical protein n=1 Tax=Enterobacter cloacae complex sp. 379K3 TaxID=3395865 RepID=UPI003CED38A0
MAADVASLAVALHLNSASFKSQFADAMRTADSSAQQLTGKSRRTIRKPGSRLKGWARGLPGWTPTLTSLAKRSTNG